MFYASSEVCQVSLLTHIKIAKMQSFLKKLLPPCCFDHFISEGKSNKCLEILAISTLCGAQKTWHEGAFFSL
jgi:hypothetical protein